MPCVSASRKPFEAMSGVSAGAATGAGVVEAGAGAASGLAPTFTPPPPALPFLPVVAGADAGVEAGATAGVAAGAGAGTAAGAGGAFVVADFEEDFAVLLVDFFLVCALALVNAPTTKASVNAVAVRERIFMLKKST